MKNSTLVYQKSGRANGAELRPLHGSMENPNVHWLSPVQMLPNHSQPSNRPKPRPFPLVIALRPSTKNGI